MDVHESSRRTFLAGLAALGASALSPGRESAAQAPAAGAAAPHRIDVHHHLSPPPYIAELTARKMGSRQTLDW